MSEEPSVGLPHTSKEESNPFQDLGRQRYPRWDEVVEHYAQIGCGVNGIVYRWLMLNAEGVDLAYYCGVRGIDLQLSYDQLDALVIEFRVWQKLQAVST